MAEKAMGQVGGEETIEVMNAATVQGRWSRTRRRRVARTSVEEGMALVASRHAFSAGGITSPSRR
jgi:hypothetical protein